MANVKTHIFGYGNHYNDTEYQYQVIDGAVYSRHRGLGEGCFFTEWEQEYGMSIQEWEAMPEYFEESCDSLKYDIEEILEEEILEED